MAHIIRNVGEYIYQGISWVISVAQTVSETIQIWAKRYKQYRNALETHRKYIDSVLDSKEEYEPEIIDIVLCERLKEVISKIDNGKLIEQIKHMSLEQRKKYIEQVLFPTISKEMEVNISFSGWFRSNSTAGVYSEKVMGIAMNEVFLASDNDYVLYFMINTIVHECKHAMQWDAVQGRNTHGYSVELIEKWRRNFNDYIEPIESDEGYLKQPVEWDASSFAESVYPTDNILN